MPVHENLRLLPRLPFPIPKAVKTRMDRLHPQVQIVWDAGHQKFGMICLEADGEWSLLPNMSFEPPITLEKTVYKLDEAQMPAQMTEQDKTDYLNEIDWQMHIDRKLAEVSAQEKIEEASDRLYHHFRPRILVPKNDGITPQRKHPGRSRPRTGQRPKR